MNIKKRRRDKYDHNLRIDDKITVKKQLNY